MIINYKLNFEIKEKDMGKFYRTQERDEKCIKSVNHISEENARFESNINYFLKKPIFNSGILAKISTIERKNSHLALRLPYLKLPLIKVL
jgi:hypothetical protein